MRLADFGSCWVTCIAMPSAALAGVCAWQQGSDGDAQLLAAPPFLQLGGTAPTNLLRCSGSSLGVRRWSSSSPAQLTKLLYA